VIAGTTGVGKTAAMINFGVNAWLSGYNSVLITGEMPNEDMQFRIDTNLSRIPGMKFRTATLNKSDKKKWDSTIKQYTITHSNKILYTASLSRNFTTEQVESIIIRLQNDTGERIEWLGLDYLNIMRPSGMRDDDSSSSRDWSNQADVVLDVKNLTQEYNLVTWSANQVKDEAYEKDLFETSDLKYARAISETVPVIIALVRSDKDVLAKRMRLQVLKMRNAVTDVVPIVLHPRLDVMLIDIGLQYGKKSFADLGKVEKTRVRTKKHTPPKKRVEKE